VPLGDDEDETLVLDDTEKLVEEEGLARTVREVAGVSEETTDGLELCKTERVARELSDHRGDGELLALSVHRAEDDPDSDGEGVELNEACTEGDCGGEREMGALALAVGLTLEVPEAAGVAVLVVF
jgi:hypothetical protein